ncbi:MAG TPA: DUF4202 domain-containing protein [Planctomycetota bacterium]|nr:DUF4202 domain-containing protein [Planctomycetota bacterium]
MPSFDAACAAIDRANAEDPQGREVDYGRRMVDWVRKLAPDASEELLLASRAQHIRRWTVPRSSYPDGRNGYLRWREDLKKFHAETLAGILKDAGYGEESQAKARQILVRKNLATDAEGQTLEDAACLVFLQFEFPEFSGKTEPDKMVDILRKSWKKMSSAAREQALGLPLAPRELALVKRALEKPGAPG